MIKPKQDYLLVEVIEVNTGIIKSEDARDSKQKGTVLAVGPGVWQDGKYHANTTEVGEVVYWEEAAEANTPPHLKSKNLYLIKEARLIAAEVPDEEQSDAKNKG
jgi:co-chaperonin GroES (HSP10)